MVDPNDDYTESWVLTLQGYDKIGEIFPRLGEDPLSLLLENDNVLRVNFATVLMSASPFSASDYCSYELPEGTFVPHGVYSIGTDIPAGEYYVYAGKVPRSYISIYYSVSSYKPEKGYPDEDDYCSIPAHKTPYYERVTLKDGYIIVVKDDVVMKKAEKFVFE